MKYSSVTSCLKFNMKFYTFLFLLLLSCVISVVEFFLQDNGKRHSLSKPVYPGKQLHELVSEDLGFSEVEETISAISMSCWNCKQTRLIPILLRRTQYMLLWLWYPQCVQAELSIAQFKKRQTECAEKFTQTDQIFQHEYRLNRFVVLSDVPIDKPNLNIKTNQCCYSSSDSILNTPNTNDVPISDFSKSNVCSSASKPHPPTYFKPYHVRLAKYEAKRD